MKKELDNALCAKFPLLYRARNGSKMDTCMCWGFPGGGWYQLIHDLSEKLESMIKDLPEDQQKLYYADQVKEKFGTLRFYMSRATEQMNLAIDEAENLSTKTCEDCGAGKSEVRNNRGRLRVLCTQCAGLS